MAGRKMTQCEKIVEYMHQYGSITQLEAYVEIGCVRLPSRIYDLKRKGYAINREIVRVEKRNGGFAPIARYSLTDKKERI